MSLRVIAAALLATTLIVAVYVPGLSGGFLLDDIDNLRPLTRYVNGDLGWMAVVTGNTSGPLGRPLSMLSFVIDAQLSGVDARAFDRTNLILHLLCAALLAMLVQRLMSRDASLNVARTAWLGGLVGVIWAVLPLHVSVVLYPVQRMAILSGLFTLLALLAYTIGRARLARGEPGVNLCWYGLFPLMTVLAMFAKENGALAPLLAGALEVGWFATTVSATEQRQRRRFFLITLSLPALLALFWLLRDPTFILRSYEGRSFTLAERLLTETRVLWDYVHSIVLPFGPAMGLVHDNYVKSTSLLVPWTTTAALGAWCSVLAAAWYGRKHVPGLLGGVLWFLAAHALEASVFPLELYFEHRNYLAAGGIVIAILALGRAALQAVPRPSAAFARALPVLLIALVLVYAAATFARASVWGDPAARLTQALMHNPGSPRLRSELAVAAAERGDLAAALGHIDAAARGPAAPSQRTLELWRLVAACLSRQPPPAGALERATASTNARITLSEMISFQALTERAESRRCAAPTGDELITLGQSMLAHSRQPAGSQEVWRTRYQLARMLAAGGQLDQAATVAERAWYDSRWTVGIGMLVFQLHGARDDGPAAQRTLERLRANAPADDPQFDRQLVQFARFLDTPPASADSTEP